MKTTLLFLVALTVCFAEDPENKCGCPLFISLVCGVINNVKKTFPNRCEAKCAGATVVDIGKCKSTTPEPEAPEKKCGCPLLLNPVCGVINNVKTDFPNRCTAKCAGATEVDIGKCKSTTPEPNPCLCNKIYDPVCGKDGKDYSNQCMAVCAKTSVDYKGPCGKKSV